MMFQHTAARRRLLELGEEELAPFLFQHTAARRRLRVWRSCATRSTSFNTQPPEGDCGSGSGSGDGGSVSTHSRPKATVEGDAGTLAII